MGSSWKIESLSPALVGGVFTAERPDKPQEGAFDCNDQKTQLNVVSRLSDIALHKVITDAWSFFLLSSTIHSVSFVLGLFCLLCRTAADLPSSVFILRREKLPNLVLKSKEA